MRLPSFTWTVLECDVDVHGDIECGAPSTYSVVARNGGASAPAERHRHVGSGGRCCEMHAFTHVANGSADVNSNVVLASRVTGRRQLHVERLLEHEQRLRCARDDAGSAHVFGVRANDCRRERSRDDDARWVSSAPSPPGSALNFRAICTATSASQSARVESARMINPPAFAWNGAWTVRFVVPATIGSRVGRLSAAEFAGEPTTPEATISKFPCDFRATDPSGASGPISRASGFR
jgi:hypothetical protein